jgi:hypothetical protein
MSQRKDRLLGNRSRRRKLIFPQTAVFGHNRGHGWLQRFRPPTKQKSLKAWLWVFVAKTFTVFALRPSRKAAELFDLLGEAFAFTAQVEPFREKIDSLLLRGVYTISGRAQATCKELTDYRERLWAFIDHEGVEPTNNAAERALRQAVIWRKLSFGTQSDNGSRFVETMLTIIETFRQQRRGTFEFVVAAITAHYTGSPPPRVIGA